MLDGIAFVKEGSREVILNMQSLLSPQAGACTSIFVVWITSRLYKVTRERRHLHGKRCLGRPSLAQRISLTWAPSSKAKFIQPLALPAVLGVRDFELLVVVEPCLLDVLRRAASSDDGTGFCGNPLDVLYDVRQHLLKHPDDT